MKQCKTNEKIKAKPSTDTKSIEGFFYTAQCKLRVIFYYLYKMKKCIKCKSDKEIDLFSKDVSRKDGKCNKCKDCSKLSNKKKQ